MSKEMRQHIDSFKKFNLNESSNMAFAYRGTEFPTQKMIDWFNYEFNQEPDDMDGLESDMWVSNQRDDFFNEFSDELMELSYFEMLDVFEMARERRF